MKGVLKQGASNVKPMAGGGAIAQMFAGDYVFGDLSTTGSDLINFDHFFRASGERFNLGQLCKVTVTYMTITQEAETEPPPPPPSNDYIYYVSNGVTRKFIPE